MTRTSLLIIFVVAIASAQTTSSTTTTRNGATVTTNRAGNLRQGSLQRAVTGSQGNTTNIDKTYDRTVRDGETSQSKTVTGPKGNSYQRDGHTTYANGTATNLTTWTSSKGKTATAGGTVSKGNRHVTGPRGGTKVVRRGR